MIYKQFVVLYVTGTRRILYRNPLPCASSKLGENADFAILQNFS